MLIGLSGDEWRLLDNFEDCRYELRRIALLDRQESLTYVWVDDAEACPNTWDAQSFAAIHLPPYVERCAARHTRSQAPV